MLVSGKRVVIKWDVYRGTVMKSRFLVAVLQTGLEENFAEVHVSVVECPDLTKDPFQFPVKGKNPLGTLQT